MILTPTDISTRPTSASALETTPALSEKENKNPATEFGAVMNTLLAKHSAAAASSAVSDPTQDAMLPSEALINKALKEETLTEEALADMLNLTPGLVTAGEPLVLTAVHLGPHLQVITPQTAAPEGQSLEVFARSQGLDEAALQWLMGKSSPTLTTGHEPTNPTALASPSLTAPTPSPAWAQNTPGTPDASELVKSTPISAEDSAQLPVTSMKLQTVHDPMKSPPPWAAPTITASDWLQGNTLAVHLIKPQTSQKLDTTPSLLDLTTLLPADLQCSLESMAMDGFASGQDSPSQGQGSFNARADANLLARTDSTANAMTTAEQDSAQRRENISTLAEKMGQAVGQRILSELERGQWHLKLSLRPATLGHIEVEMRMRSGEMDAVFTAPQALTRELLNEGMSKLRDTLNQMGMDVASLKVDDGQSRQRGGESTPERQAQLNDNAPTESADAPVSPSVAANNKMGIDGWDVLV
jgi:flagellar hook-length control protein FliK